MKRISILIVILLTCMSFAPTIAQIPAPNDTTTLNSVQTTLSIDGYVTTKFASVGSDVEIIALTRGHTSSTLVTADIIKYPEIDPIDLMTSTSLPGSGVVIDTVVMTQTGAHENDSNTMVWEAVYTIPSNSAGGVFGARVIAEDGNLVATDDPTQLSLVLRSEFEKVLQAIDDAWDSANPCLEVKGEFDSLQNIISSNGNWSTFVAVATEGQGVGGSQQLWNAMIDAGHNQYDMSAGANFLTALMEFFDSDDIDASMSFITGLLLYAGEFPLPRTFDDFDDVAEYAKTFDAIENYTRFEGTGDFEAAYNALVGSNEWVALRQAMDDLANSTKVLEATQTITHNIALLAVSGHPDAIIDAIEVWATPLIDGDIGNMTPVQVLIVRWIEMADYLEETDVIDTDGDEIPDQLIWQYEKLLETSEGQAWTANMESASSSSYVNDAFDNFNTLPEDVINDIFDSMQDPIWNATGEVLQEFVGWMSNASFGDRNMEWESSEEEEESSVPDSVIFEELYDVSTTLYGGHILDIGIELRYWGPYNDSDYPSQYSMSMTNNHGVTKNTVLEQKSNDRSTYLGRLTADYIEDASWTFTQPLENYNGDMSTMDGAHLKMESLRPSMLEMMSYEGADETFIVSALGVVVEQDETTLVSAPYSVTALAYNATGPVENAEVDAAIVRVSPQLAEETIAQFSPDGDVEITSSEGGVGTNSEFSGDYTGNDLAGDVSVTISPYSGHDDDREYPQASSLENDIEVAGSGSSWDASNQISGIMPPGGLVDVTTSGTTVDGLEFEIMKQVPLPDTSGCARTEGNAHSGNHVDIGWSYGNFWNDEGELDKPELSNLEVDWGDGDTDERQAGSTDQDGWWGHDYSTEDAEDEYTIVITYSDVDGREVIHSQNVTEDQGFWRNGEDGGGWFEGHFEKGECELRDHTSVMPTALIIDGFFTDGPIEVMDEQILTTNQNGEVTMTSTPTFTGFYLSIVQSKTIGEDGITYTGLGMNFGVVTEASLSLGGLTEETTLAGIPVYSVQPDSGGLTSISVTPSGVSEDNYNVSLMVMPMELKVPFTNIDENDWGEEEEHTLEFQQGDTTRSQEVRIKAPISMIAAMILEEGELFPTAIHVGLILNNPTDLNMTGTLGPGQITNIALRNDTASRILAMAAPRSGFDPATLDLSSLSELFYTEGVRQEIGWIPAEQELDKICEKYDAWSEERWENNTYSNVRMSLRQKMKVDYVPKQSPWPSYDPINAVLTNSEDESLVTPISDWTLETDGRYYANYDLEGGKTYLLNSTTDYGGMFEFELSYEEGWPSIEYHNDDQACLGDNEEMSDDEVFDLFDEFFSDFNSVAWGQGSSADLRLPILSSPSDDYTVIAVAQVGEGENIAMVSAWGSEISVPNPEPPQMENLTLSFSPANPMPDDIVQVTATDEDNQPVDGLSFTVVRNNQTLVALVSNDYGQVEFAIPEGTIIVRASGGNYYPAELTIVVSDSGSTVNNGSLPSDTDGDGVDDSVDACPSTPIGTTVDAVGCAIVTPPSDTDGDGVYDSTDACPNTPTGTMVDAVGCAIDDGTTDNNGTNGTNGTDGTDGTDGTNGTDNTDDTDGTDNTGTAGSGDEKLSTTTLAMIILTGLILAAIGVATMVLIKRRKGGDDWDDDGDVMFDSPDRPAPNARGEMMDGYEVIEYPKGTGAWWYRDNESGHWMEWT